MSELYISKVKLSSGNEYVIKDAWARQAIEALGSPTHFLGVTTSELGDGSTTNPIVIKGASVTAKAGDIVVYGSSEFIWDGAKWVLFGDLSNLGDLAYHDIADIVVTVDDSKTDSVLGANTSITAAASQVSFASGAGSDFVTGYNDDAVAPSFSEGAFDAGSLPSYTEGEFTPGTLPTFKEGAFSAGTLPSFTEGTFDAGTLPSKEADTFTKGSLPSFTEGAFTPASLANGFVTPGVAASYSHSGFDGGSLGASTKAAFAAEGIVAEMGSGDDAETLIFSAATKANAVTEQGAYTPATYGTDTFNGGTPTAIDVTKFNGGNKVADTWDAGTLPSYTEGTFDAGTLPSKAADTWSAGTLPSKAADSFTAGTLPTKEADAWNAGALPSKAADTFNAGSAATLAKAKAITAADKAEAAAQVISVGTNDLVDAVTEASASIAYKA